MLESASFDFELDIILLHDSEIRSLYCLSLWKIKLKCLSHSSIGNSSIGKLVDNPDFASDDLLASMQSLQS